MLPTLRPVDPSKRAADVEHGHISPGPGLLNPLSAQDATVYSHSRRDAGTRHRSQQRNLQRGRRGPPAATSVPRCRARRECRMGGGGLPSVLERGQVSVLARPCARVRDDGDMAVAAGAGGHGGAGVSRSRTAREPRFPSRVWLHTGSWPCLLAERALGRRRPCRDHLARDVADWLREHGRRGRPHGPDKRRAVPDRRRAPRVVHVSS